MSVNDGVQFYPGTLVRRQISNKNFREIRIFSLKFDKTLLDILSENGLRTKVPG